MSERAHECRPAQRADADLRSFSTSAGERHRPRRSGSGFGSVGYNMSDSRDPEKRLSGVVLSSSPLPVPALSCGSPSPSISSVDTAGSGSAFGGHGYEDGDGDQNRDEDFYILEGDGRAPLITTAASGAEPSAPSRVSLSSWGTAAPSVSSASPSLSAPSIEQRTYVCLFHMLDCHESFDDDAQWQTHVCSHFRSHPTPPTARCPLCPSTKFVDGIAEPISSPVLEDGESVRSENIIMASPGAGAGFGQPSAWDRMLDHVAAEHYRLGQTLAGSRPDFELMRYLYGLRVITDAQFKAMQLPPAPSSPAYHRSQDGVRASIGSADEPYLSKQDKLTALDDGPLRLRFLPRDCLQHENSLIQSPILLVSLILPLSAKSCPSTELEFGFGSISSPPTHLKSPDMERLSLNESPANAQRNPQQQQQQSSQQNALGPASSQERGGPPQLPPQMFTTAAQLLDLTDKKLVLILRDGRKLIGVLRSWDQFANLVFQETIERIYAGGLYADVNRGIFIVRGENVLLLGEVDLDREDDIPPTLTQAPFEEVFELKKKEDEKRSAGEKKRYKELQALGFEPEHSGEILF
ncbi:hypothetical protein PENANT_c075G00341 [Penicillium antarcticum]|uniref:U6 snRNA-associated Sm-like protein LSm1 n=1 Tax=Penicillium antarcticum TaxID=416450 RepID=A0A1V6PQP3_9EURO|nr:hypothetical protein PENANT_c075G00341 [Penicillium antarcticum]